VVFFFSLRFDIILYSFSVNGKATNKLTYRPVDRDSRLLAPANATIWLSKAGNAATSEPLAAAIILPLPIPEAIANDRGSRGVNVAKKPARSPKKTAPKTVPNI